MSATLRLEIRLGDSTNGTWIQGREWNPDDEDWTKLSTYYYQWTGGKNWRWGTDTHDKPLYQFDAQPGTWDINVKNKAKIRDVIFCAKDAPAPNILDSKQLSAAGYTVYPQNGNWSFIDSDTTAESLHVWVWAQMDNDSPIIRCDPMVHNKD